MSKKAKTTSALAKPEFWVTVITSVAGLLLAFGAITPEQSNSIVAYAPNVIGAVMSLLSTLGFVKAQHLAKVEVFRAMCAVNTGNDGEFKAQGVESPEAKVAAIAASVGL